MSCPQPTLRPRWPTSSHRYARAGPRCLIHVLPAPTHLHTHLSCPRRFCSLPSYSLCPLPSASFPGLPRLVCTSHLCSPTSYPCSFTHTAAAFWLVTPRLVRALCLCQPTCRPRSPDSGAPITQPTLRLRRPTTSLPRLACTHPSLTHILPAPT
jgi:hypothetical protein